MKWRHFVDVAEIEGIHEVVRLHVVHEVDHGEVPLGAGEVDRGRPVILATRQRRVSQQHLDEVQGVFRCHGNDSPRYIS